MKKATIKRKRREKHCGKIVRLMERVYSCCLISFLVVSLVDLVKQSPLVAQPCYKHKKTLVICVNCVVHGN